MKLDGKWLLVGIPTGGIFPATVIFPTSFISRRVVTSVASPRT
jgi:hypothetical protein